MARPNSRVGPRAKIADVTHSTLIFAVAVNIMDKLLLLAVLLYAGLCQLPRISSSLRELLRSVTSVLLNTVTRRQGILIASAM